MCPQIGCQRDHEDTLQKLREISCAMFTVRKKILSGKLRTQYRIKDCYMETFVQHALDKLANTSVAKDQRQKTLTVLRAELLTNIFSPVWRLSGLDLHSDMHVEILHVVLLGFVWYF